MCNTPWNRSIVGTFALTMTFAASGMLPLALGAQAGTGGATGAQTDTTPVTAISGSAAADPLRGSDRTLAGLSAQARALQNTFEANHRIGLRFYNGGADAFCEVQLGRICYWNNNGDVPPPAERTDAKLERDQLVELLNRAAAADPADDWVNGMRVRYFIEAEKVDSAILAARQSAGTAWWNAALQGLALHNANQHVAAAAAFEKSLASMPAAQRCTWTDLTWWLDPSEHAAYQAIPCGGARSERNARIFRLAQPLWMLPANDLSNEVYARRTMSRVHSLGRIPYDLTWGDDLLESQVRYGWPTAWSVQNGGYGDPRPPSVVGHEPTPSYDFMPNAEVIATPVGATNADWEPNRKKARMRYAPRYASGYGMVPHQFARFRRGDTTLLAGGYRLVRELEMGRAPYTAALVLDALDGKPPVMIKKDSAAAASALLLPITAPTLASLEVIGARNKRATRVRTTVQPLARQVRLSDFLLLQKGDASIAPSLERNAAQAYGSTELDKGATVGLYWEIYRPVTPEAPVQVEVRALRIDAGLGQRLGNFFGLSKSVQPVAIRYTDNGRPDGQPGRSITLTFPPVAAGEYQLSLVVSGGGVSDTTSQTLRIKSDR